VWATTSDIQRAVVGAVSPVRKRAAACGIIRCMSGTVAALLGVVIGGLFGVIGSLGSAWLSARDASRRFAEERQTRWIDEVASVMDGAGLALERIHWVIAEAIDAAEGDAEAWQQRRTALEHARAHTSRLGSRLAIRLGPRSESPLVDVYEGYKVSYWQLVDTLLDVDQEKLDADAAQCQLEQLGKHDRYFQTARDTRAELGLRQLPRSTRRRLARASPAR
jgi:hypothetical protein